MGQQRVSGQAALPGRGECVTGVMMKRGWMGLALLGVLSGAGVPGVGQPPQHAVKAAPPALLPADFSGFHVQGQVVAQSGPQAASIDAGHAAVLREDGLLDAAQASYVGADGTLEVHAYRFGDATGAYAAFTAFREPGMRAEPVGVDGDASGERHLFWTGATLVDATAGSLGGHAAGALRALAAALPKPRGPAGIAPPLRGYLPTEGLVAESVHYAIGPAGYAAATSGAREGGAAVPDSVIDFGRDAEAVTARYKAGAGTGSLLLLEYPTPQMAAGRQKAIAALVKSGAPGLAVGDPGVVVEQIGPLVALTSGSLSAAEAHRLIRGIHYEAAVTINHPEGYVSEVSKAAKLLLGIGYMVIILFVAAVLLALFLGGGRVMIRRLRGKPDSSLNDEEFISLKIG